MTEGYFNSIDGTDPVAVFEGVILTAMEWGPKAIANPGDLEAPYSGAMGGLLPHPRRLGELRGPMGATPYHMIEHTLSAYHNITHAAGLPVVNPSWMRFAARHRPQKLQFAKTRFRPQW